MGAKWLIESEMFNRTIDHRHTLDFKMFIGLDIGADFHLAACIPFDKVGEWKRQKTTRIEANGKGIFDFFSVLREVQNKTGYSPSECMVIHEPTGGHYGFLLIQALLQAGYPVFEVNHKAVKDFREGQLGLTEKSDTIDAKVMAVMGSYKLRFPEMKGIRLANGHTPIQSLFRTLTRDRWLLTTQLTRRKNQMSWREAG